MTTWRRLIGLAGLAGLAVVVAPAWARAQGNDAGATAPLSVADALEPPRVLQAALSPDGRYVAAITFNGEQRKLMLVRADDLSHRTVIEGRWGRLGGWQVSKHPLRVSWVTPGVFAVDYGAVAEAHDLDGKVVAELGGGVIGKARPAQPDSTLMLVYGDEHRDTLEQVDVKTLERKPLALPPAGNLVRAAFDENGQLRAVTMSRSAFWDDQTTLTNWWRPVGGDSKADGAGWQKLHEFGPADESWWPLAASAATGELIVATRLGRDTSAIFTYDTARRALGELLAGHPREDIVDLDDPRASQYMSVVTQGMRPSRHWFDGRWAALQKAVDQALPQRENRLSGDPRGRVLVFSHGDVDPGRWLLLDTATMALRPLLVAQPRIDPARMRPMDVLRYRAPDGLEIPAYLTRPAGTGPHPLVVMVHGGPTHRDHWGWDAEVQLLASRGYAVFQPQFRGSTGFGGAFERAGYGQWGRAMQDDITAGVQHLVATGVADAARVCIYGASYGGYAAVWGLVKTPELYRCGVSLAGISDIGHALSDWSDRNSDKFVRELQRFRIGDRNRDKARFDEVSPLLHARRIRAPVLVVHGEDDIRVPISHSRKLVRALEEHDKPHEWLPLPGEGHTITWPENRALFTTRLLAFLERHLGPPGPR